MALQGAFFSAQFFIAGNIGNIRINVDVKEQKENGGDWEQITNVDSGQKRYYPGRRRRASVLTCSNRVKGSLSHVSRRRFLTLRPGSILTC